MSTTSPSTTAAASTKPGGTWAGAGRAANTTSASATMARGCIACFGTIADLLAAAPLRDAVDHFSRWTRRSHLRQVAGRPHPQRGNFGAIPPLDQVRQ